MNRYLKTSASTLILLTFITLSACYNNDLYDFASASTPENSEAFNPQGILDDNFGTNGIFTLDNTSGGAAGDDVAKAITVDSDGNIFTTGFSVNSQPYMTIWKILPQGVLDTDFGKGYSAGGFLVWDDTMSEALSMGIDPAGYFVGAGLIKDGDMNLGLWKCSLTGVPDETFGNGAVVQHDSASEGSAANGDDLANDIAITSDGQHFVTGYSVGAGGPELALWKYDRSGKLDTSFSGDGFHTCQLFSSSIGNAISLDTVGNIFVAGISDTGTMKMTILKYQNNGILDTSFGKGGYVTNNLPYEGTAESEALALALDTDNNIYACGYVDKGSGKELII